VGYLVNDWVDRGSDKLHFTKCKRPFASGKLGRKYFLILLTGFSSFTVIGAIFLGVTFFIITFIYLMITLTYTFSIKNLPVIEMVWLASGFLVRAVAGSIIVQVKPTGWFNITVFFGALFLVSAKRQSEKLHFEGKPTRKVIQHYDSEVLSSIINVAASATLLTYCLWVIQEHANSYLAQISILPFVSCILLYKNISKTALAGAPEDVFISNKPILISASISVALLGIVFYQ
jgi:decaprenyl-phosphate phosphoribosyltransferase